VVAARPFGQRGNYPLPKITHDRFGRALCRWCEGPVERPRLYWCSEACVLDYRMRADWPFMRDQIIERDKVCQICGGARYSCMGGRERAAVGWAASHAYYFRASVYGRDFRTIVWGQFNALEKRWEVDHIKAIADGGTDDPTNLRLLCLPCHKQRTARWHQDRAEAARGQQRLLE
jgi:5-methylcytosine-specific restriction protein A